MDTTLPIEIIGQISGYIRSLDWSYILTFILIAYGLNNSKVTAGLKRITGIKTATRYRVSLIGLLYAIAIFFSRNYSLDQVECLFQSFVFALVFHKLIIEGLTKYFGKKKLLTNSTFHQDENL